MIRNRGAVLKVDKISKHALSRIATAPYFSIAFKLIQVEMDNPDRSELDSIKMKQNQVVDASLDSTNRMKAGLSFGNYKNHVV